MPVIVGPLDSTTFPDPVELVTPVPPLVTASAEPSVTPVEKYPLPLTPSVKFKDGDDVADADVAVFVHDELRRGAADHELRDAGGGLD